MIKIMNVCERCGRPFECGMESADKSCWCFDMPTLSSIPSRYVDCLCPPCLNSFRKVDSKEGISTELVEGENFYFEKNLMVFTKSYLQKRGHCCLSGCRHCPWADSDPKSSRENA